MIAQIIW